MKSFDLLQAPLEGIQLIEAGAGTGKTFNIAGLFLRLIAEQGLRIDEILVVTFTKAATEELKNRIRHRLISAKSALNTGYLDPLVEATIERGTDRAIALQRILDALTDFDRAAIFTIHGFCQRILNYFAFETGYLFEAQLVQDDQPLVQEMADDYWRRHIAPAPEELVAFALKQLKGPEELAALFHQCRAPWPRVIPPAIEPSLGAIEEWRAAADQVCQAWPAARETVLKLLASEGINARNYGKCEPDKTQLGTPPRMALLSALAAQMDQWQGRYPSFKHFDRFTTSYLAKATKKNYTTPEHRFFELCEHAQACLLDMEAQMVAYLRYLKVHLLKEARQQLDEKKKRQNVLFFDDLLLQVHGAMQGRGAAGLIRAIRDQYRAALVDEFQDTDALQYEIFTQLFGDEHALLFMIGDPKQAIYSFRGADLFSYLHAKKKTRHQYTLASNWRATPPLVQAINALFANHPSPFGYDQIVYTPAVAARPESGAEQVPFHLWYLTRGEDQGPARSISQEEATERIVAAVAEEIVALLSTSQADSAIEPQEIAVLTRTHRQAQKVKAALAGRRVPAVLHSAGSVFETREAESLALVLEAVAMPADPFRVRAAMASDLICTPAHELNASVDAPAPDWEARWAQFDAYHHIWQREGFYPMFSRLMAAEGIKPRLLTQQEGERRLTNLLHLAELLHQASLAYPSGPEGLLTWFANQRRAGGQGEDVQKLRLESDARAVRIITIHKSKGLQFEVVFCPFVWAGARVDDNTIAFHDPDTENQLTMAIGPGIDPAHRELALQEALTENLRLLYVAVTRAKRKCFLAWGCIKGTEISAPAYLLHNPPGGTLSGEGLKRLRSKMAAMTDSQLIQELGLLEKSAGGTILLEALPLPTDTCHVSSYSQEKLLDQRDFQTRLDNEWRIASFSSLTAGASPENTDPADRDAEYIEATIAHSDAPVSEHLFGFPKGARAGLFFHDLLEHCDFVNKDNEMRRKLVADKLLAHGFEGNWVPAVDRMLVRLAAVRLPTSDPSTGLRLSDVPWRQRVNEMEFHFPLKRIDPNALGRIFQDQGGPLVASMHDRHWNRLTFSPVHGFMKGYVDMIFEHSGRFYLVDWKSNHLGNAYEDYAPSHLYGIMGESFYYLQYHLYVIALDQWLRGRIRGYRYDRHFGGVYYLFIRGIGDNKADTGLFYDLPKMRLVASMRKALLDNSRGDI